MVSIHTFRPKEYIQKKRTFMWIRFAFVCVTFSLFCALISYLAHRPSLRISEVLLSGQVLVTEEDIKKETLHFLEGKHLWLFPKNNALIYNKRGLTEYLKQKFKRIDMIDIGLENYHTVRIAISERKPFALWCDALPFAQQKSEVVIEEKSEEKETHCYFMDSNSTLFAPAPQFSGDAYFKYYGILSATSSPIGLAYMKDTRQFEDIDLFVRLTQSLSIKPQYLIAKDNGEYSLVLFGGGIIYFDIREPLQKTGENLRTLLQSPVFATSVKQGLPVDYIDLRFGNKLFYKLK